MSQGDVKISQTVDGGDIESINGVITLSGGLETAVYLALFGGNEDDSGSVNNSQSWWGNRGELSERQYRSKTQYILKSLPAVSASLLALNDAVRFDLAFFLSLKIASSVDVLVTIPGLNRVSITIDISAQGEESSFNFTQNWKELLTLSNTGLVI